MANMKDIPIIFSAPMIQALLDGRKTRTRRLAWRELKPTMTGRAMPKDAVVGRRHQRMTLVPSSWQSVKPGDRLWVRENIKLISQGPADTTGIVYAADFNPEVVFFNLPGHKLNRTSLTPCIHMPRRVSRLTLVVTGTKIERLQAISEQDCEREGCVWIGGSVQVWDVPGVTLPSGAPLYAASACESFAALWDTINGSGAWLANPEVVALTFAVHKQNIDKMPKAIVA